MAIRTKSTSPSSRRVMSSKATHTTIKSSSSVQPITKSGVTLVCGHPDVYGVDCGRRTGVDGFMCTFCTKYEGGCPHQRKAQISVTYTA